MKVGTFPHSWPKPLLKLLFALCTRLQDFYMDTATNVRLT
jgi:hypothetical protein